MAAFTRDAHIIDSRFKAAGIPLLHAPLNSWLDVASVISLRRELARHPDRDVIVHVHRYRDALFALLAKASLPKNRRIKIVATRHFALKAFNTFIYRRIYSSVDFHIFSSELVKQRFLSSWRHIQPPIDVEKDSAVLHPVADITPADAPAPEPASGPVAAIYVGRLIPGVGLETLIDALSLVKKLRIRLKIVGTGNPDYVDSLRLRAQHREVTDLIDWRRHCHEPEKLIRESHFGVFPSLAPEAYNFSMSRMLALGRPVITTAVGSQNEILTNGKDALFIPPADPPALAEAMRMLAKSGSDGESAPELRLRLGSEALSTFRSSLNFAKFTDTLSSIYASLLRR